MACCAPWDAAAPSASPPHAIYNLGNHKSEKLTDFIAEIEKAMGKKAEKSLEPIQPGDVPATFADIEASTRDLGFAPTIPISAGIPKFVAWFRDYYRPALLSLKAGCTAGCQLWLAEQSLQHACVKWRLVARSPQRDCNATSSSLSHEATAACAGGVAMGIDLTGLRALFMVKRLKLGDFSQTATLGRQEIFFLESEFEKFAQSAALGIGYEPAFSFSNFQEPLLKALGAAEVTSFDASPYEGATAIQDFNKPLAPQFEKRFSMFLDFGSMEHVFNIPQVVKNVNALLRPGGPLP